MVDVEHLLESFVLIVAYGLIFAPLLTDLFDSVAPTLPSGLIRFFIYLIVPVMGFMILYYTAVGGKKRES